MRIKDQQCSASLLGTLSGASLPVPPAATPGGIYVTGEVENACAVIDTNEDDGWVLVVVDNVELNGADGQNNHSSKGMGWKHEGEDIHDGINDQLHKHGRKKSFPT
jgi:hypothetical protein